MKKILSAILACFAVLFTINAQTFAANTKKYAKVSISPSMRPIIAKYKNENYVGALLDLESLVKKEKNNTLAKYYLALCYTKLGYKNDAKAVYSDVVLANNDEILSQYSKKALVCLDNPLDVLCKPPSDKKIDINPEDIDDITLFIRSGKQIHPAAMDMITKQRMEIKLQEEEYIRRQQQNLENFDSYSQPVADTSANGQQQNADNNDGNQQ